jgi:two-component system response regulator YesN
MASHSEAEFTQYVEKFGQLEKHILEALRIMWDDAPCDLSVEIIARRVGMSSSNFARRFKLNLKRTPMAVLAEIRVTKAKPLLAQSNKSIKEVAIDGGWLRRGSFSRSFKRVCGITPTEYRNLNPPAGPACRALTPPELLVLSACSMTRA